MPAILIQWAKAIPEDWTQYNITRVADVRNIPRKALPTDTSVLDNQQGWIASLNLQGVIFDGFDHIGVEIVQTTLIVKAWNDGPQYPVGTRWAQVWTFTVPKPDIKIGNLVNTDQTLTWYGEPNSDPAILGIPSPLFPWVDFVPSPANQTWHGIQMLNSLWEATQQKRNIRGWREWIV